MFYSKVIDLIDKYYHHKRINKFCKIYKIKILVDVGAHKGEFISNFIKNTSIKKVYAFEPQIDIFNHLKNKFKKKKGFILKNFAISDKNGYKKIKINRLTSTSSLSKLNKNSFFLKFKNILIPNIDKFQKIKTKTIDKFFINKSLGSSLLKIDVEGHEWEVLISAKRLIRSFNYIIIEKQKFNLYRISDFDKSHRYLVKNGFVLIKKFKFPTFHFEDRLYVNKSKSKDK